MNYPYAIDKLRLLLRDINRYSADEFRRQMVRIINGSTGTSISDDCHLPDTANPILAQRIAELERQLSSERTEKQALAAQVESLRGADAILCAIANGLSSEPVLAAKGYVKGFGDACLAHVRAEAVNDFFSAWQQQTKHKSLSSFAAYYAERIRQGGAS